MKEERNRETGLGSLSVSQVFSLLQFNLLCMPLTNNVTHTLGCNCTNNSGYLRLYSYVLSSLTTGENTCFSRPGRNFIHWDVIPSNTHSLLLPWLVTFYSRSLPDNYTFCYTIGLMHIWHNAIISQLTKPRKGRGSRTAPWKPGRSSEHSKDAAGMVLKTGEGEMAWNSDLVFWLHMVNPQPLSGGHLVWHPYCYVDPADPRDEGW